MVKPEMSRPKRSRFKNMDRSRMYIVSVKLPLELIVKADWLVDKGYFSSRSEVIREGLRLLMKLYNVPDLNVDLYIKLKKYGKRGKTIVLEPDVIFKETDE